WLTERQNNPDWKYRLPEKGEAEKTGDYWIAEGQEYAFNSKRRLTLSMDKWLLTKDYDRIGDKLLEETAVFEGYMAEHSLTAMDRDVIGTLDRAVASTLASARDLAPGKNNIYILMTLYYDVANIVIKLIWLHILAIPEANEVLLVPVL